MPVRYSEPEQTEPKHYHGEAEASDADKAETGGEKTLQISSCLFQSNEDAEIIATALLARLKDKKEYEEIQTEFCPVPIERRDTVKVEEYISPTKSINHTGLVRGMRLDITQTSQNLTLIIEE